MMVKKRDVDRRRRRESRRSFGFQQGEIAVRAPEDNHGRAFPTATVARFWLIVTLLAPAAARGQEPQTAPADHAPRDSRATSAASQAEPTAPDGLAQGRRLLEGVRDGVFSFDDPGFYWFCRYVKQHRDPSEFAVTAADSPIPWRFLLERPSDYRGQLVTVEGILQSRPVFIQTSPMRGDLDRLTQCELSESGTRSFCTVITTDEAEDTPVHSRVRAKGYFIKVRGYTTDAGETGAGPLIVARRLEVVRTPSSGLTEGPPGLPGLSKAIMIATAALAVIWLLLRRGLRPPAQHAVSAWPRKTDDSAPSENDFDWMTRSPAKDEPDEK